MLLKIYIIDRFITITIVQRCFERPLLFDPKYCRYFDPPLSKRLLSLGFIFENYCTPRCYYKTHDENIDQFTLVPNLSKSAYQIATKFLNKIFNIQYHIDQRPVIAADDSKSTSVIDLSGPSSSNVPLPIHPFFQASSRIVQKYGGHFTNDFDGIDPRNVYMMKCRGDLIKYFSDQLQSIRLNILLWCFISVVKWDDTVEGREQCHEFFNVLTRVIYYLDGHVSTIEHVTTNLPSFHFIKRLQDQANTNRAEDCKLIFNHSGYNSCIWKVQNKQKWHETLTQGDLEREVRNLDRLFLHNYMNPSQSTRPLQSDTTLKDSSVSSQVGFLIYLCL